MVCALRAEMLQVTTARLVVELVETVAPTAALRRRRFCDEAEFAFSRVRVRLLIALRVQTRCDHLDRDLADKDEIERQMTRRSPPSAVERTYELSGCVPVREIFFFNPCAFVLPSVQAVRPTEHANLFLRYAY